VPADPARRTAGQSLAVDGPLNLRVPRKPFPQGREVGLKRIAAITDPDQTMGFDHDNHPQRNLPRVCRKLPVQNTQVFGRLSAEMTEYVIREIGPHKWLVFEGRQSIALCADENEAVKVMTEHSARGRQSSADCCPEQDAPAEEART
jgi:hypothetical protein